MSFSPSRRHPELVSGAMPQYLSKTVTIQLTATIEAWMLKQVQHDGTGTKQ